MNITKARLKQLIKEEMDTFLDEEHEENLTMEMPEDEVDLSNLDASEEDIVDVDGKPGVSDIDLALPEILQILKDRGLSSEDIMAIGKHLHGSSPEDAEEDLDLEIT